MVVAVARNGVIGNGGALPWRLSVDLQRFKRLTMGHTLLMGRKTYESIGKLLPGRSTVLLSRNPEYRVPGARVVPNIEAALSGLPQDQVPFVVGGAEVYRLAWPLVGYLHLTQVLADVPGDTRLEPLDLKGFDRIEQEMVPADPRNEWPSVYELWVRRRT